MKCWFWLAQKNALFRLPWYSMYIGVLAPNRTRRTVGTRQTGDREPAGPPGPAMLSHREPAEHNACCLYRLLLQTPSNTSKMDLSSLHFLPYLQRPNYMMVTLNPAAFPCYIAPFLTAAKSETLKDRISLINHQAEFFFFFFCLFFHFWVTTFLANVLLGMNFYNRAIQLLKIDT